MTATAQAPATRAAALEARGLRRVFIDGARTLEVLKAANLTVAPGEVVALVGRSGSGKSTLLHLLGLLDRPDGGEVLVDGTPTATLSERDRAALRNRHIGFVFQHYFLMADFDVLDNVLMPARIEQSPAGWLSGGKTRLAERALQLLEHVGLKDQVRQRTTTLSGGERQRVGLCRALLLQPRVLLCDEPTGNLDPESASRIMKLIFELTHRDGVATVVVSHDVTLAERADRVLRLDQGVLQQE